MSTASTTAPAVRMLWQNTTTGDRSIWLMNGTSWDGSYAALSRVATPWSIAGSADFNADGEADIVWQNTTTGDRSIWFMTGNTWSGGYALLPQVSTDWSIAGVGDFNTDGKPDLLWQNTTTGDRSIWFMNGSTWNGSYALLPQVATQWDIAAVGDFNADAKQDLVWQNTSTGERSIWFMNGATWSGNYALLITVPPAWRIAAAADFDGDADPDLVWQNISTGERSIWLMTGSTWNGTYASLPTVTTQWRIAGVLAAQPTAPTTVSFRFCAPLPIWVGYQQSGGSWTRVSTGPDGTYSFNVASRGGVAIVTPSESGYSLEVLYATAAELATIGPSWKGDCRFASPGMKNITVLFGTIPAATPYVEVTLGPVQGAAFYPSTSVVVGNVPAGTLDLVAVGRDASSTPNALKLHRAVDAPDGGSIDLTQTSWLTPASANLTVNNLGSDDASVAVSFSTARGTTATLTESSGPTATHPYRAVPTFSLTAGDLHQVAVHATPAAGTDPQAGRVVTTAFYSAGNRAVTLGPQLAIPRVTSVASSPYARYRVELARQVEYDAMAFASFVQDDGLRQASVFATANYVGGTANWDVAVPDLSSAAGFDANWGLRPAAPTTWSVIATKGFFFAAPTADATVQYAGRTGAVP